MVRHETWGEREGGGRQNTCEDGRVGWNGRKGKNNDEESVCVCACEEFSQTTNETDPPAPHDLAL